MGLDVNKPKNKIHKNGPMRLEMSNELQLNPNPVQMALMCVRVCVGNFGSA